MKRNVRPWKTDHDRQRGKLILEHLRALRTGQDEIRSELKEIKARPNSREAAVVGNRRDTAHMQEDVYQQNTVIDRIKERLERIERRLELT